MEIVYTKKYYYTGLKNTEGALLKMCAECGKIWSDYDTYFDECKCPEESA